MVPPLQSGHTDSELELVLGALEATIQRTGKDPEQCFGSIVRRSIDEVIDGPRTGRWELAQLTKTEKTYVGTKVEILVRSTLSLEAGVGIDTVIEGVGVDVKWSQSMGWMIGQENVERLCLGLGLGKDLRNFSVGLFRARRESLREGSNQDKKLSLTAEAMRTSVLWLVSDAILPANFIADLPEVVRGKIFAGGSAQDRLRLLAELVPGVPIPRQAIETVAMTADPLRRTRRDAYKENPLGRMVLLSTKYGRLQLESLGFKNLPKDHWVAVESTLLKD